MKAIVADYIARHREKAERELRYFRIQRTLEKAVSLAALARKPNGKRFPHQRRLPESVLKQVERKLVGAVALIRRTRSFAELHGLVDQTIRPIFGVGELMVYDTALRIGARLGLEPQEVFLHSGTRVGARRLGLDGSRRSLPLAAFPAQLRRLPAQEIEDILCIYKDRLGKTSRRRQGFGRAAGCD